MPEQRSPQAFPYGTNPVILPSPQKTVLTPQIEASYAHGDYLNLREQFDDLLTDYGQMVLLQRLNLKIHCTWCWNTKLGEPDPQCPYCLGRGFLSVLERRASRRWSSLNEHRQQLLDQLPIGGEVVDEVFWFFSWDANPQDEDIVYEVTWSDSSYTVPQQILTSYRITYATPLRGVGGRVEYWRASAKARPVDRDVTAQHLHRIAPQAMTVADDGILRYEAVYRS